MTGALAGSRAFVTGGTGSMGRAIVQHLVTAGIQVAFTGRSRQRGQCLETQTGAVFLPSDAMNRRASDECLEIVLQKLGHIDIFVSCIGLVLVSPLEVTVEHDFREVLEVNLTSVFRHSRTIFQHMQKGNGGAIIHIVSDAALRGLHHIPVYSVAKAGLLAMSELLAAEGAPHKIRVNAICPGATVPGVQATLAGRERDAENHQTWGPAPSGRHGAPSDVARAVLWLSSTDAAHISGATLRIDGGASAAMRTATRA